MFLKKHILLLLSSRFYWLLIVHLNQTRLGRAIDMVSTRAKSTHVQKSVVDQAIQVLAMLPDRSGQESLDSSTLTTQNPSSNTALQN